MKKGIFLLEFCFKFRRNFFFLIYIIFYSFYICINNNSTFPPSYPPNLSMFMPKKRLKVDKNVENAVDKLDNFNGCPGLHKTKICTKIPENCNLFVTWNSVKFVLYAIVKILRKKHWFLHQNIQQRKQQSTVRIFAEKQ